MHHSGIPGCRPSQVIDGEVKIPALNMNFGCLAPGQVLVNADLKLSNSV